LFETTEWAHFFIFVSQHVQLDKCTCLFMIDSFVIGRLICAFVGMDSMHAECKQNIEQRVSAEVFPIAICEKHEDARNTKM